MAEACPNFREAVVAVSTSYAINLKQKSYQFLIFTKYFFSLWGYFYFSPS